MDWIGVGYIEYYIMDLDSNNFTKSVWIDMELSQPDKELIDVSELYLTKIYPSLVSANEII